MMMTNFSTCFWLVVRFYEFMLFLFVFFFRFYYDEMWEIGLYKHYRT
jgi:hypothetical protein